MPAMPGSSRSDDAPVTVATIADRHKSPAGSPGLTRVQSDKTLGRSPRTGRRNDSRSPSPGNGRSSPAAPPPRAAASMLNSRVEKVVSGRRALSPSQSEGTLRVERMSSAPTHFGSRSPKATGGPSVAVVTASTAGGRTGAAGVAGRQSMVGGSRTGPRQVARPMSPDKCGGPPRVDPGSIEETPQTSAEASARRQTASASCSDDEDCDTTFGPRRRRLSTVQYEALVRCAQQVVTTSAMPPPPQPVVTMSSHSHCAPPGASATVHHQQHQQHHHHHYGAPSVSMEIRDVRGGLAAAHGPAAGQIGQ